MISATFKSQSLDSLLQLYAVGTENLMASIITNESPDMTVLYQKVLDEIQYEIVERRAKFLPVK